MLHVAMFVVFSSDPLASAKTVLRSAEQSLSVARANKETDASKASQWFKLASDQADSAERELDKLTRLDATHKKQAEELHYVASLVRREFVDELLDSGSFLAVAKAGDPYKFVMTATRLAELATNDDRLEPMFASVGCQVVTLDGLPYAKCR